MNTTSVSFIVGAFIALVLICWLWPVSSGELALIVLFSVGGVMLVARLFRHETSEEETERYMRRQRRRR